MTERERQAQFAAQHGGQEWHFHCADGEDFAAVAVTESGAFGVLNAERPGMIAESFDGTAVGREQAARRMGTYYYGHHPRRPWGQGTHLIDPNHPSVRRRD